MDLKCFLTGKTLKALYNPAQNAMTDHNEFSWVNLFVCPTAPQLKHDFKGVKAFWEFHFQAEQRLTEGSSMTVWSAVWNAGRWNHVRFDSICPHIYLCFSKCLTVSLSFTLCAYFSQDFLTVLICRKTHECMQLEWNLMDSQWTSDIETFQVSE